MSLSEIFLFDDMWDELRVKVEEILADAKEESYDEGYRNGYDAAITDETPPMEPCHGGNMKRPRTTKSEISRPTETTGDWEEYAKLLEDLLGEWRQWVWDHEDEDHLGADIMYRSCSGDDCLKCRTTAIVKNAPERASMGPRNDSTDSKTK